ncbi:MAG: cation-translocating P-type ATPase [Burkholderiaceae bacterium]|nr:MAG: cation-translocating P-type ATPase [Burkholderiaceae bacterium]
MPSLSDQPGLSGLAEDEARQRLARQGPNEIDDRERQGWLDTLRGIASEPMFLLLLMAAGIYLLIGDLGEGLLLAFFAVLTVGLVVLQERRCAHALDALRELATPQVNVLRDGRVRRIAARDLVTGDLFALGEGERVAADGVVREAVGISVDESLLTGESVPVRKRAVSGPIGVDGPPPGGDDFPAVYAGTLVVAGHGWAEVTATGRRTQVGRIGASLSGIDAAPTPLQRHLRRLVRAFGLAALGASALLVTWYGWQRGDWMQGLLSAIALGMAMLPEEFPMALAVFLALGAWRLARIRVLARRPAAIEALGSATILCVDKTGTLTENRMQVRRLVTADADVPVQTGSPVPEPVRRLLEVSMLASRRGGADPMDRALFAQGEARPGDAGPLRPDWRLEREYPLTPQLPATTQVWNDGEGRRCVAAKGAPEAVFALCQLPPDSRSAWLERVRDLAQQGLRVRAVAEGLAPDSVLPDRQNDIDFELRGLVGFEDPLRASVPASVEQARAAGIAVAMVTGDHAQTALAVAAQAGIDTRAGVLSGDELARLDDAALTRAVRQVRVFARVLPEQKLRLVEALKRGGETVAMTGDGVNDAPALKAAHIGIAMGGRGTDVAREAASVVLLDDDFGSIVAAVRMGRRIFDNLRKVMIYITAIHVPIAGLSLLPVLFGLPALMLPAHVVLTEMVIDPVCSLAFEGAPEDPRVMQRPPRQGDEGIVGRPMLWQGLLQGLFLLAATLVLYVGALNLGRGADIARTLAVVGLTAGNLLLVAVNLTAGLGWRCLFAPTARAFWWVAAVAFAALGLAVTVPGAQRLLQFAQPATADLLLALGWVAGAVALGAFSGAATQWRRTAQLA